MIRKSLILILLTSLTLNAAPLFNFDYATFRASDYCLLQIYTMIHRESISFKEKDGGFTAEYSILVEIKRGDALLASSGYDRADNAENLESITSTQKIPEETSFHIKDGDFTIVVSVTDNATGEMTIKNQDVMIEKYSRDRLTISDIEFASDIKRSNQKGIFTKNQLQVIPHADRVFGGDINTAYYYAEIYNFSQEQSDSQYTVQRSILDQNNEIVKSLPEKIRGQSASSVVEADFFSVATLPTGTYFLKLEVIDGISGVKAEKKKQFWIYKPGEEIAEQEFVISSGLESSIDNLSDEQIEQELEYLRYLTNRAENKMIKKLKRESYPVFLLNFWIKKDPSGIMRDRYLKRIEASELRYGTKVHEGWKTDRGRVLILYGEPDYIERRLFELNAPDTEAWFYDKIEGGVVFLFTDIKGTGDLVQVYSSMRGEFIDAGWLQDMEVRNPQFIQEIRSR